MTMGLIGLIAAALGWVTTAHLTHSMLEREKTLTVDYIARVVREHISPAQLRAAQQSRGESAALQRVAAGLTLLPEVVRVKIYNPQGTIIWSDVAELIGKNFHDDHGVRESLQGRVVVELEQMTSKPEHQFEHPHYRELTSIYVPIRADDTGELLAVFEIYKNPVFLHRLIRKGRFVLWTVVLAGGGLLFLGQSGLVASAGRTINRQYSDLQRHAKTLEDINARLQDTQAQLVEAERFAAIGEVTAAVAHGIRNPLGNIRLVTQESLEGLAPHHPCREPLTDIITQVDFLEARLRSFLSTVKPFDLSLTPFQFSALIDMVLEGMRQHFDERGVQVIVDLAGAPTLVQGDLIKLAEVLQVLLTNSLEAGAHTITIVGHQGAEDVVGHSVQLHIIDDGAGLSPSAAERLFHPFFTTKTHGTGLGLVIAQKIIVAHGGRLILEPYIPHGTRATVWLPGRRHPSEGAGL
jgi:signal transduction histidine kinase